MDWTLLWFMNTAVMYICVLDLIIKPKIYASPKMIFGFLKDK